jgi:hypothetical protein
MRITDQGADNPALGGRTRYPPVVNQSATFSLIESICIATRHLPAWRGLSKCHGICVPAIGFARSPTLIMLVTVEIENLVSKHYDGDNHEAKN